MANILYRHIHCTNHNSMSHDLGPFHLVPYALVEINEQRAKVVHEVLEKQEASRTHRCQADSPRRFSITAIVV